MSNPIIAWLAVCLVALALVAGLGAAELLAQAFSPVSEAITGSAWCAPQDTCR